jgi:hypothetical protein
MFKINKGVPLPDTKSKKPIYPFRDMKVGDSFAVPMERQTGVRTAARYFTVRHEPEWEFRTFKVTEDGVFVMRVWRTK